MNRYPNSRVAPHQVRAGNRNHAELQLYSAKELGEEFVPNRAQRRLYVRLNQGRNGRLHLVGMGRWRRHNESTEDSWAKQTAVELVAPRAERRPAIVRAAKVARWLRRRMEKGQS